MHFTLSTQFDPTHEELAELQLRRLLQEHAAQLQKVEAEVNNDVVQRGVFHSGLHGQLLIDRFGTVFRQFIDESASVIASIVRSPGGWAPEIVTRVQQRLDRWIDESALGLSRGLTEKFRQWGVPDSIVDQEVQLLIGACKGRARLSLQIAARESQIADRGARQDGGTTTPEVTNAGLRSQPAPAEPMNAATRPTLTAAVSALPTAVLGVGPGRTLGRYRLLDSLGAGAIGAVYRALDTTLNREVALKILAPRGGSDARERFRREAQALAALDHPFIAAVFDFGEDSGIEYLVMELVRGQTLRAMTLGTELSLRDAVRLADEIAAALECAHAGGVIHRDLKPANVMITPDRHTKVLDFGLAKLVGPSAAAAAAGPSLTSTGTVLGTPEYMSPEQAHGEPLDARTDVWSWACVLFEVLAGTKAFPGNTLVATLVAVQRDEPPWEKLPPNVPARLRWLLRDCLRKDRVQRPGDMTTVRNRLAESLDEPLHHAPSGPPASLSIRAAERVRAAAPAGNSDGFC